MIILLLISIWFKNPRIKDTILWENIPQKDTAVDRKTDIIIEGEKSFYVQGAGKNGDIFQSTNIRITGKTREGWRISGFLYDNRLSYPNDVYTISLKDANTAYLTIKKAEDSFLLGRYSIYGNRLDGGYFGLSHSFFKLKGGVGIKTGEKGIFDTIITPPYFLPIKITQKQVPIIEGSENVFIDGKTLDRTQYRIDYVRGILYLYIKDPAPRHKLLVTYQYHTPHSPLIAYDIEGILHKGFVQTEAVFYKEDQLKKGILDSTGGVFYPDGGGDYEKQDSIFVYVGKGKGHYIVYFLLDTINGSYDYVKDGDYYIYVGKGAGHYTPEKEKSLSFLSYSKISLKTGKDFFLKTSYLASQKITNRNKKNSRGMEFSLGIEKKILKIEGGIRKTDGHIFLPSFAYSQSTYSYRTDLYNEKYMNLYIGDKKRSLSLHSSLDTIFYWNTNLILNRLKVEARGEQKVYEVIVTYNQKPLSISLYRGKSGEKFMGFDFHQIHLPQFTGFLTKDTKNTQYGLLITHSITSKKSDLGIEIGKTTQFFIYNIRSAIKFNIVHLQLRFARVTDINNLFIERYIKTPSGSFTYDSVSGKMLPSDFGEFMRMIVPIAQGNLTHKYLSSLTFHLTPKSSSFLTTIRTEKAENANTLRATSSLNVPLFYGTRTESSFLSKTILTNLNTLTLYSFILSFSTFLKKSISPGINYQHEKDELAGYEKRIYGGNILLHRKNLRYSIAIQKGSFKPFEKEFYTIKNNFNLSFKKYSVQITTSYSTTFRVPFSTYLEIGASYNFKLNTTSNTLSLHALLTKSHTPKWQLAGQIKF